MPTQTEAHGPLLFEGGLLWEGAIKVRRGSHSFGRLSLDWAFSKRRPDVAEVGRRLHYKAGSLYHLGPPRTFSPGDAVDTCLSDPKTIIAKLRVHWGHASAHQHRRVLRLVNYVGDVYEQCGIRRPLDKAPRIRIAGTLTVSALNRGITGVSACAMNVRCMSRGARLLEVPSFNFNALQDPSRSMRRFSQLADCHVW